jgi:shikimate kinase
MAKRILLTGMSGTGKSSLIGRLAALGYRAVDVDDAGWNRRGPDGGWIWREDLVERFLAEDRAEVLFLSGCAESQVRFYALFDHIVLLSAPSDVLMERLLERTNNPYGKRADERAEVREYIRTVEPLLRDAADHEVDATAPPDEVLDTVLRLVGEPALDPSRAPTDTPAPESRTARRTALRAPRAPRGCRPR